LYDDHGALIRKGSDAKAIYLLFSADEYGEGFEYILDVLDRKMIKGSFFLTGKFLRNKQFAPVTKRLVSGGYYLGPHSDGHLLYIPWEDRDTLLVTKDQFNQDIRKNIIELGREGVREKPRWFLAPYEWYNSAISRWSEELGLTLVNFTPGTGTNADYTTPEMANYRSSEFLLERLAGFEENSPQGLSGALLLIHPGTDPARGDKFYHKLEELIEFYREKGYTFKKL
ncbi:MAG: polysaccharide deacetylase family protein, partial [Bacteroidales bacterium]|nr:polysaccharide deacetylase family protein [Bacteroidales bacterium]